MRGLPNPDSATTTYTHAPAANTEATQTVAAVAGHTHIVDWIAYSYDGTPAATKVATIAFGGFNKWNLDAHSTGLQYFRFPGGFYQGINEELVASLPASGDAGVSGKINFGVRTVAGTPHPIVRQGHEVDVSGSDGAAAQAALSALATQAWTIDWIHCSADAAALGGPMELKIFTIDETLWTIDIADGQPKAFEFPKGVVAAKGLAIAVACDPHADDKARIVFGYH